ncbi:MAG: TolC family protein [Sphingobacteriaceae bacterium]|nr:MAG: TolC family protein [Sphingobacteriaceae bacterium]
MKKTVTILIFILVGFKTFSQLQPTGDKRFNFSIADCINYAYEHQNTVVNANLDIKSAEYRIRETIGTGLPQISGQATFTDYLKLPTTLLPGEFLGQPGTFIPVKFGVNYNSNLALNASQLIFSGSYFIGLKAAKTFRELSNRNYTRSKIDVNVEVTKAYYQVLVSNEQIRLLDANINQLKQQVDQTTAQNKQGFVEKIDVDRITVQYNNLVTNRENILRLLALNYQLLKFQMGMPIEYNLTLADKLADTGLDNNVISYTTDTTFYRNRVEYGLLETQKNLYGLDVRNRISQYYPSLTANGSAASAFQNNTFGQLYNSSFPSSYVGLTLNVPIFNGFQRYYQVKQAKITYIKSQNDLINLKNSLNLEASQASVSYTNGLQTLNNQKKSQELAREVLRVSKIKYQQGVGSSIEVTQAQTELENADNQYIQGLYDALVSKVDLDRAYGRIK